MAHARFRVTLIEGTWIHDVSTAHPAATFRVLSAMPSGETGVGLVEIETEDVGAVLADMDDHPGLAALDPLDVGDDRALVQFETDRPMLLLSARESRVPIDLPVEISDGHALIEFTAPRDRLAQLADQFETFGIQYTVEQLLRTGEDEAGAISERQRGLLEAAVEAGYYDVPRGCTLTELADQLGIAKSTASERLHWAESAVVKEFLGTDRAI